LNDVKADAKAIFLEALDCQGADELLRFLAQACGSDAALRTRVEELLRAHQDAGAFLGGPVKPGATRDQPGAERPGAVIGPYKLLQQIGEGGMGTVFLAEQTQPVQRKVALKVIKAGMDTRQVIARFEAERQALALMDHVNIARVLDAGTTDAGLPYFVMELVHGVPITKYCDDNHLTPRARLELFVPVCQAIQHAHQKGIIHRDIKPSNVLVTLYDGKPVPKVIDFGVAKATEQKLTERTLFTQYGTLVGTLEYMSPEQADMSALGVDTRSDIYSLGVLLYELLTGSTPLTHQRLKEAAYGEILRMIREEEPPRPSTRLSDPAEALASISAQRHTEPAKLSKLMRGELDWIVMKTLEKDRNRRYETANDFAADVQRYLTDEPVQACPPSAWYRFRKFARRNRGKLAVAAGMFVAVTVTAVSIGWAVRDRAEREAEIARQKTSRQQIVAQLVARTLAEIPEQCRGDRLPEAGAALKRAEVLLAGGEESEELLRHVDQVRTEVQMATRLEEIRLARAEVMSATPMPQAKANYFDSASVDQSYEEAFQRYGLDLAALAPYRAAEHIGASIIKGQLVAALHYWFLARKRTNHPGGDRLLEVLKRADAETWRSHFRAAWGRADNKTLMDMAQDPVVLGQPPATVELLGVALNELGERSLAIVVLRLAQRQHPSDFWLNQELAMCLPHGSEEKVGYLRVAVALRPESPGAHYRLALALRGTRDYDGAVAACQTAIDLKPDYAAAYAGLGDALNGKGNSDSALAACRKAIELNPKWAWAHGALADALRAKGDLDGAIAAYRKAIEVSSFSYAGAQENLARTLQSKGDLDGAIVVGRQALERDPNWSGAHGILGDVLRAKGDADGAIAAYREAIKLNPDYAQAHSNLGELLRAKGALDGAIAAFRKAIEIEPKNAVAHGRLGDALRANGDADGAVAAYRKAIKLNPDYAGAHLALGILLRARGDLAGAITASQKAIEFDPKNAGAHTTLAYALQSKGDLAGAIAAFQKAIEFDPKSAVAYGRLGDALRAKGEANGAIAAFRKALELDPDYAGANRALGNLLRAKGDLTGAIIAYRKVITLKPDDAVAHDTLGNLLRTTGDLVDAISCLEKANELSPTGPHCNGLAWLLATCPDPKLRDPQRAVALARKAVELAPKQGHFHTTLGVAYYRLDSAAPAVVAALNKSVELRKGGDVVDWLFLAMAHGQQGNCKEGRKWYDQAVQWLEKNKETLANDKARAEELRRFRSEAEVVLELKKK
jgi:eukaryotic-like serine/threonine-protein kinase